MTEQNLGINEKREPPIKDAASQMVALHIRNRVKEGESLQFMGSAEDDQTTQPSSEEDTGVTLS
jgi:hypothetical protein